MERIEFENALYLAHHGVKGQKWGERRYQNEDGSYKAGAEGRYDPEPSQKSNHQIRKEARQAAREKRNNTTYKVGKASFDDESGNRHASNGMKIAVAKNKGTAFGRKMIAGRFGEWAMKKKIPGVKFTKEQEERMRRERQAMQEEQAHLKDVRKGTGNKYLAKAEKKSNLENATKLAKDNSSRWTRLTTSNATFKEAGRQMVKGKTYKQAMRSAKTKAAITYGAMATAAVLLHLSTQKMG